MIKKSNHHYGWWSSKNRSRLLVLIVVATITILRESNAAPNTDPIEGRYSFSLTTFHPSGKLPQLEHAIRASTLGPPIIALTIPNNKEQQILLSSIQNLPSPLMNDDGTARFVKISNSIIVGHTGVNADGRVLCEAAQRLSVEHTYTFDEEIPVDVLLEEMALLFQEYTMKPGCRPFGSSLIVASLDSAMCNGCSIFRIDPAGTVTKLDSVGFVGRGNGDEIIQRLRDAGCMDCSDIDEAEKIVIDVLRDESKSTIRDIDSHNDEEDDDTKSLRTRTSFPSSVICAKLCRSRDITIKRIQM